MYTEVCMGNFSTEIEISNFYHLDLHVYDQIRGKHYGLEFLELTVTGHR